MKIPDHSTDAVRAYETPVSDKHDWMPLWLTAAMLLCWCVLHLAAGTDFVGPSLYDSYTRQALAWREGQVALLPESVVPWLELAQYQGRFFVSFPPLPSVVLFPLTFLFGADTPDHLLVKLYALCACLMAYHALKTAGYERPVSALLAFCLCFASSMLPLTMDGAVWYHAQTLAFLLTVAAILLFTQDRMTGALLCYALSVACRPFNALYAVPIFGCYFSIQHKDGVSFRESLRSLLPGIGLGFMVAVALAVYNAVRFGDPFEFGHNYLPEFSTEGGTQFSLSHVPNNLRSFLFRLPLYKDANGRLCFQRFGFCLLLANPMIALTLAAFIADCVRKRMTIEKALTVGTMLLHLFLLLTHRTGGGFQLGMRYAVDVIPGCMLYLLLSKPREKWNWAEVILCVPVFLFMCIGFSQVHI